VIDKRRATALTQLQRQFTVILSETDLAKGARGEERTLYSLRHTCIMYRLMYGEGMDLLTLARNARTSAEMIERFYASNLTGEMNIDMLQSRRSKKRKLITAAIIGDKTVKVEKEAH
jgi:integrase